LAGEVLCAIRDTVNVYPPRTRRLAAGAASKASSAPCALRQADVEVLRQERREADRACRDDVLIATVEPDRFDLEPLSEKPLLDTCIHRRRALGLEIRVAQERRRRD
jgi:hypothetical protein